MFSGGFFLNSLFVVMQAPPCNIVGGGEAWLKVKNNNILINFYCLIDSIHIMSSKFQKVFRITTVLLRALKGLTFISLIGEYRYSLSYNYNGACPL